MTYYSDKQTKLIKSKQYRQYLEYSKRTLGLELSKLEEDLNDLEASLHIKEKQKEKFNLMLIDESSNSALCPQRRLMQMDVHDEVSNKIISVNNAISKKTAEYLNSKKELYKLIVNISTTDNLIAKSLLQILKVQQKKEDERSTEIYLQKMYSQREMIE